MTGLLDKALISIFLSFPEAILILLLGFALTNMRVEIKKIILMAGIQAMIAFAMRILNISMGPHLIVQVITFSFLVSTILNIKLYRASVPVLIGIFIQGIGQGLLYSLAGQFLNVDYTKLGVDFRLTFVYNLPIFILSILLFFIVKKKEFTLL